MADSVLLALAVFAGAIVVVLVWILVVVRRQVAGGRPGELAHLSMLPALKETADQRLPIIQQQTSDLGQWILQSQKQRSEEEKLVRESLAKLQESTRQTPELHQRVAVLQTELKRLQHVEQGVRELQNLFLSAQGRGAMGEEAVRAQFQGLPPDMWGEQQPLGGGKVDFVVRMPNQLVLPIDSKTSGLQVVTEYGSLGQRLKEAASPEEHDQLLKEQGKLQTKLRQAVLQRAGDVAAYIQPENGTLGFAIQAVPDSLYGILDVRTRREASDLGVQIVPYGLLLPVAHMLRSQNQHGQFDMQAAIAAMQGIRLQTNAVRDVLVNKFEKAQKFIESGVKDVREAVATIDQNADGLAEAGAEGREPIRKARARLRQAGLVES